MATEREILARAAAPMKFNSIADLRAIVDHNAKAINAKPPEIGAFHEDVELRPGLRADVSVPKGAGPYPVVLFIHGGGWGSGSSKTHKKLGMEFAAAGNLCINLDYRLAPEHPFPAGFDDCVFAARWTADNARRWGGDASRMAIGGDSAGANLTAATLIELSKDPSAPAYKAALLFYGLYDIEAMEKRMSGDTSGIGSIMNKAYMGAQYPALLTDPRVSPILGVRPGAMPASLLLVGTNDNLEIETYTMAQALLKAGIPREVHVLEDMPHAFMQIWMVSGCTEGLRLTTNFLKRHLVNES